MNPLFRVWNKRDKTMQPVVAIDWDIDGNIISCHTSTAKLYACKEEFELMQYTRRNDRNGNKIFEGDIVRFTYWWFDGNERETPLTGTIVYDPSTMSYQLKGVKNQEWQEFTGYGNDTEYLTPFSELCFAEADFTVIGNVHDNPEMLEAK